MANGGYEVEGGRQLRATLKAAGDDLGDLREAHQAVADIVATAARADAPVMFGSLRDTIRGSGTKTAAIVRAGNNKKKNGVPYAAVRHWGWWRKHIKPTPFISSAAQSTEPRWIGIYSQALDRSLAKIKGK
ncbi:hypothetical protein [Microterricola viridarii]|uniref:Uncharacterized protein n=1 Tax=Microterricola viridarii TaxID=412690 RepID=A0A0X8E0R9_9MICO|nr:hypothetical protein [Microterricola viridarii]AMB58239.1 hypothetical protein AWU67_04550 [Microterricola viridarii]